MQLEQEYEEKQMVIHEKHDLEGLIATLCDQVQEPRCISPQVNWIASFHVMKCYGLAACKEFDETRLIFQVGHRDFDVEKKLRRDLKRTHALLADAQLLLSTVDSQAPNLPSGSREQIERLHCQVDTSRTGFASTCPLMVCFAT